MKLIRAAYGIPMGAEDNRITGGPNWLRSEKYDVDAKVDSSVVDELKTLSQDQRTLAQQQMLEVLLADRCKLAILRETKDLAIYTLVIAKKGPKVQEREIWRNDLTGFRRTRGNAIAHRTGAVNCEPRAGVVSCARPSRSG